VVGGRPAGGGGVSLWALGPDAEVGWTAHGLAPRRPLAAAPASQ